MEIQRLKIKDLAQNKGQIPGLPTNPRQWTREEIDKIARSLKETPELFEARPIIVTPWEGKFIILGGNLRFAGCKANKDKDAPCIVIPEGTPVDKMKEIVIKDNGSFGAWDYDALANLWDDLPLTAWGVPAWEQRNAEKAENGGAGSGGKKAEEDGFDEKEPVEKRCTPGDLWALGNHRLYCGDSMKEESFAAVMGGDRADITITSPPYNVIGGFHIHEGQKDGYCSGKGVYKDGYSDNLDDRSYAAFLCTVLDNALKYSDDVFFNIGYTRGALKGTALFLGENAEHFCGAVTWKKNQAFMPTFPVQHGILGNITEPVYVFREKAGRKMTHPQWGQGEVSYNVVETENASGNEFADEHSATFPVAFPAEFISRFSAKSVLDCFGGTGTTMIAAEQLGRRCFMIELDPHYCDLILARWEKLTGGKAELLNPVEKVPET